jgi:hypothetical protein
MSNSEDPALLEWQLSIHLAAIQSKIGRELRAQLKLSKHPPHRIILMQLDAQQEGEGGATAGNGQGGSTKKVSFASTMRRPVPASRCCSLQAED